MIQLDKRIYDSENNISVAWMWDSGIVLRLGDEVGGFIAEEVVETAAFLWSLVSAAMCFTLTWSHNPARRTKIEMVRSASPTHMGTTSFYISTRKQDRARM